ncbi:MULTISPECIES: hypothetical protein [unclassified Paenibacillus]|uniref:hypothetical protein n=1 Tax=unclassified Paenibacillus TaxID=185978 RepID=UPI0030F4C5CC
MYTTLYSIVQRNERIKGQTQKLIPGLQKGSGENQEIKANASLGTRVVPPAPLFKRMSQALLLLPQPQ